MIPGSFLQNGNDKMEMEMGSFQNDNEMNPAGWVLKGKYQNDTNSTTKMPESTPKHQQTKA